ncbi:SAM-dependent methyltransferase [Streptomyces sp. NPDC015350]|uniref:SAM-dependent methyltransferase n=1 Tax=Streptomyces sp. NPDC015350 TaxID=3364955 RepID=UPI0036F71663
MTETDSHLQMPGWALVPSVARIWDYVTGGTDNYPADRALAGQLRQEAPWLPQAVRSSRSYGQRAVEYMARAGITQFLDLGCGMPFHFPATPSNSLHTYDAAAPFCAASVVYVDNDPVVYGHAKMVLAEWTGTVAVQADVREVGRLLNHQDVVSVINLSRPVAVLGHDLLCWMSDEDATRVVAELHEGLAPGSALSVAHATTDTAPDAMAALAGLYAEHGIVFRPRSHEHIEQLLGPWTPVDPGLVAPVLWPEPPDSQLPGTGQCHAYAAVALHQPERTAPPAPVSAPAPAWG